MIKIRIFFVIIVLHLSVGGQAAIFGNDDRHAVTPSSPENPIARSTAVGVLLPLITQQDNGKYKIETSSLSGFLCADQKFSLFPSIGYACSAFLVAPDLLVTAGHCSVNVGEAIHETELYCKVYGWVFDYQVDDFGQINTDHVSPDNFYTCKEIVYAINNYPTIPSLDFAIIRLDRPVINRTPLKLSPVPASVGSAVSMIGHPDGAPTIFSGNANVLAINPIADSVITNLDAFDGNSGSAVFNQNNDVVGILIGGTPASFVNLSSSGQQCSVYNTCDVDGKNCLSNEGVINKDVPIGSEVQNIAPVVEMLKSIN